MNKINRFRVPISIALISVGILFIGAWEMQRVAVAKVNTWIPAAPLPDPLAANLVQCVDDLARFYMVGGITSGFATSDQLMRYDIADQVWERLADMPAPRRAVAAACYLGKIYVAGGWNNFTIYDNFYIYDIASNTWSSGPNLTDPIWAAALGAWDGKLFLVGGNQTGDLYCTPVNRVDVYDIATSVWTPGAGQNIPTATACFASTQVGSYLYVVGGTSGDPNSNVDQTQRYNMAIDQWEFGPQFTSARALGMLSASSSHLYMLGGDLNGGTVYDPTDRVEELDLSTWPNGSWIDMNDPLPAINLLPASTCSEVLTGGEAWSVGGMDTSSVYDTNLYRATEPCVSFGVELPEPWENKAEPGDTITYTIFITNTGVITDYYTLDISTTWNIGNAMGGPGPIGPGESMQIDFLVQVPPDAMWGDQGVSEITATSISNPDVFDTTSITTIAKGYEFTVTPFPSDRQDSHPGWVMTYTLQVANIGDYEDSYDVAISATWETTASLTIGPLLPGEDDILSVVVTIPEAASPGDWDEAVITLTSQAKPEVFHDVTLTSTAVLHRMLTPLAMKN